MAYQTLLFMTMGPQYVSEVFHGFVEVQIFDTSPPPPHHPKSNGKSESAVKACKSLVKKMDLAKSDVYLFLLDH